MCLVRNQEKKIHFDCKIEAKKDAQNYAIRSPIKTLFPSPINGENKCLQLCNNTNVAIKFEEDS